MFVEVNMKLTFCADEMPFRAFVSRDNEKTHTVDAGNPCVFRLLRAVRNYAWVRLRCSDYPFCAFLLCRFFCKKGGAPYLLTYLRCAFRPPRVVLVSCLF